MIINKMMSSVATWQQSVRRLWGVPTLNKKGNKQTLSSWIQDMSLRVCQNCHPQLGHVFYYIFYSTSGSTGSWLDGKSIDKDLKSFFNIGESDTVRVLCLCTNKGTQCNVFATANSTDLLWSQWGCQVWWALQVLVIVFLKFKEGWASCFCAYTYCNLG